MIEELKNVINLLNALKTDCDTGFVIYACRNSLVKILEELDKEEDNGVNNPTDTEPSGS